MRVKVKDEATNPGNIGGYKNTPYTGNRLIWNKDHQREIGSHDDWHDKDIYTEGIADIFDMMRDQPEVENSGVKNFEEQIKPHSADELYKSVCYVLATKSSSEDVRNAAQLFLPVRGKGEAKVPKGIDEDKFEETRNKIEDAVVEYCTSDAMDILERIRNTYKKDPDKITPEINYGTILFKATSDDYDLQSQIEKFYKEWKDNGGEEKVNTSDDKSKPKESPKSYANTIIKELSKSFPEVDGDTLMATVAEIVTSEFGIGLIKQTLNGGK